MSKRKLNSALPGVWDLTHWLVFLHLTWMSPQNLLPNWWTPFKSVNLIRLYGINNAATKCTRTWNALVKSCRWGKIEELFPSSSLSREMYLSNAQIVWGFSLTHNCMQCLACPHNTVTKRKEVLQICQHLSSLREISNDHHLALVCFHHHHRLLTIRSTALHKQYSHKTSLHRRKY